MRKFAAGTEQGKVEGKTRLSPAMINGHPLIGSEWRKCTVAEKKQAKIVEGEGEREGGGIMHRKEPTRNMRL